MVLSYESVGWIIREGPKLYSICLFDVYADFSASCFAYEIGNEQKDCGDVVECRFHSTHFLPNFLTIPQKFK
jgi:hypothetical protein